MRVILFTWIAPLVLAVGCSSTKVSVLPPAGDDDGSDASAADDRGDDAEPIGFHGDDSGSPVSQRPSCPGGGHTTVSGTVYAPNGTLPLYNVIVYAPAESLPPLSTGASCQKCGTLDSVKSYATALSDAKGHFTLVDPPTGKNVPLVVQVGKWRRSFTVPNITACTDNPIAGPDMARLPRSHGEGSLPKIGVTTGGPDKIPCLLPKLGIDASEFGVDGSTAVTVYQGGGGLGFGPSGAQPARTLWDHADTMKKFDLLIFSCEGSESIGSGTSTTPFGPTKDATSFAAMRDYLDSGGRIFGTDFQYTVWKDSPDPNLAGAATIPGGAPGGDSLVELDTTFPKGKALADWVANLNPMAPYGKVTLDVVYDNVSAATSAVQVWGRGTSTSNGTGEHPRFMTVNTPVGASPDKQCGKAVHLDAHVDMSDAITASYPSGCSTTMSNAEKAFAFFFFDLASCIQPESAMPEPPAADPPK